MNSHISQTQSYLLPNKQTNKTNGVKYKKIQSWRLPTNQWIQITKTQNHVGSTNRNKWIRYQRPKTTTNQPYNKSLHTSTYLSQLYKWYATWKQPRLWAELRSSNPFPTTTSLTPTTPFSFYPLSLSLSLYIYIYIYTELHKREGN